MKRTIQIGLWSALLAAGTWSCSSTTIPQASTAVSSSVPVAAEQHRSQFHFSPPAKWMNDPNGMVYYKGEYHLFYQHYPDGTKWGPMHWGHAVSKDLVHWEHLPIALYPDKLGYIFSGSAVIDQNNTSGLGSKDNPPMVAIYTYHDPEGEKAGRTNFQTQGIAYSLDKGRTWNKYEQNPVLPNPGIRDFRDPKVSWNPAANQWVMTMAVLDHIEFYGSKNLREWTKLSEFGKNEAAHGGVWECPDLFPMQVNGQQKWVLLVSLNPGAPNGGSGTQYFVGTFDGKTFTSDNSPQTTLWLDYGTDNYAGVTWDNIPKQDGRRLFMGWMNNWAYANDIPTTSWRGTTTIPWELKLKQTESGIRLFGQPVKELEKLRGETTTINAQDLTSPVELSSLYNLNSPLQELELNFDLNNTREVVVSFSNSKGEHLDVGYAVVGKELYIDRSQSGKTTFKENFAGRHQAPLTLQDNKLKLHILLDVASIEVFANDGKTIMTELFFPNEDLTKITLKADGGNAKLETSKVHRLQSIWKNEQSVSK